jgi:acyl carrier protein
MGQSTQSTFARLVRSMLAERLRRRADEIPLTADLRTDLGLAPLDLVVVALRVEDVLHVPVPIAPLEHAHTVADLVALLGQAPA